MDNDLRQALKLALKVLEDLPEMFRPERNIEDMREILAGLKTGRDQLIMVQAVATALAYRSLEIATTKQQESDGRDVIVERFNSRMDDFSALFSLVKRCDLSTLALYYTEACTKFAEAPPKGTRFRVVQSS
jgi:hypothetical protein